MASRPLHRQTLSALLQCRYVRQHTSTSSSSACTLNFTRQDVISSNRRLHQPRQVLLRHSFNRSYSFDYRTSGGWIPAEDKTPERERDESELAFLAPKPGKMGIMHIVMFEFKPTISHAEVEKACNDMLSLPTKCLHPQSQQPYVKGHGGGRNNSPEGLAVVGGYSHAFISEFESEEDRQYYLEKDPAHLEFVKSLDGVVQNVQVVDFVPGKL